MALPTLEKTWQYNVNQPLGGQGTATQDCYHALITLKNSLKTFALSPWTVWGSCGKVLGQTWTVDNGGGTDHWTAVNTLDSNTVGNPRAWIVLRQTGLGTNCAICIDLLCPYGPGYGYYGTVVFLPTGVGTNGSTTTRPTAADEIVLTSTYWGAGGTCIGKLHVMQSTDGECTRILLCRSDTVTGAWIFDKVKDPVAAWTVPVLCFFSGNYDLSYPLSYTNCNDLTSYAFGYIGSTICKFYITSEGYVDSMSGERWTSPDEDSGAYSMCPMGLACPTVPHRGNRKGTIYDLWWGTTATASRTTYPADATRQFANFGQFIFPWNGTIPQTT
jgi:hypothetical protein